MKIALLGHGTIGVGVDHILKELEGYKVTQILSLIVDEEMAGRTAPSIDAIVADPEIGLVVEVMGGVHPAYEFISACLKAGKHVVTANKAVAAACYEELNALALEHHVSFRYTASAGGSIPWLFNLARAKRAAKISTVSGIMNGTCNYILSEMTEKGTEFDVALAAAQELGYAEKNPAADIDGNDTARKLALSLDVLTDGIVSETEIPLFGIRNITASDIAFGLSRGLVCRLLAVGSLTEDGAAGFVEPVFLPASELLAHIPGNYNYVYYDGDTCGIQGYFGQGAGRYPTAYNIVQDIIDIAVGTAVEYTENLHLQHLDSSKILRRYYVRTASMDETLLSVAAEKGEGYVLTSPVSVSWIHDYEKQKKGEDPALFIAGLA